MITLGSIINDVSKIRDAIDKVEPQDEAGLTKTFQTWPRGWFHIP